MALETRDLKEWGRMVKESVEALLPLFGQNGSDITISENHYRDVTVSVATESAVREYTFVHDDRARGAAYRLNELINFFTGIYGQPQRPQN
jgi:hypothetical protein